jgi:hypothetical protein
MSSQRSSGRSAGRDHHVRLRRDTALERTRSITKTVGVASVAAVAAFGIYLSRALPGHAATSTGTTATTVSPAGGGASTGSGASSSQSPTQLTPPTSPPVQTQQQAPVVSGSS